MEDELPPCQNLEGDMPNNDVYNNLKFLEGYLSSSSKQNHAPLLDLPLRSYAGEDPKGIVIDWAFSFLQQHECPPSLAVHFANHLASRINELLRTQEYNSGGSFALQTAVSIMTEYGEQLLRAPESRAMTQTSRFVSSDFAVRNKRRKMEDKHVVIHDLNTLLNLENVPEHSYYAIFDGHAGIEAAFYASAYLHLHLAQHPAFLSDIRTAFQDAYNLTDKQFCTRAEDMNVKCGCTALSALIRGNTLFLAWLGDSNAVLIKQGKPISLMDPHIASRRDEIDRIENLGGYVCNIGGVTRVNGQLAVSRALGDMELKPYVSSEPDISETSLDGTEDFLVLACDGLWDVLTPEDVSFLVYHHFAGSHSDADPATTVAKVLVDRSQQLGSDDNISVIVVLLRSVADITQNAPNYIATTVANGKSHSPEDNLSPIHHNDISQPGFMGLNCVTQRPQDLGDVATYPSLNCDSELGHSASAIAPEATALSELPTPPIDDMVDGQHISSEEQSHLLQSSLHDAGLEVLTTRETEPQTTPNTTGQMTPEEAVTIASDVVATTIETAVKRADSAPTSPVPSQPPLVRQTSAQKLNPNAEPFVMKNFLPNDALITNIETGQPPLQEPVLDNRVQDSSDNSNDLLGAADLVDVRVSGEDITASNPSVTEATQHELKDILAVSECIMDLMDMKSAEQVLVEKPCLVAQNSEEAISIQNTVDEHELPKPMEPTPVPDVDVNINPEEILTSTTSGPVVEVNRNLEQMKTLNDTLDVLQYDFQKLTLNSLSSLSPVCQDKHQASIQELSIETEKKTTVVLDVEKVISGTLSPELLKTVEANHPEELQPAPVALDLQAVPDGVPEAEGVSEDIDSDSEKDGGWCYVKADKAPEVAPKQAAKAATKATLKKPLPTSQGKTAGKREQVKTTKDLAPTKPRLPPPAEKNRKPVTEKKTDITKTAVTAKPPLSTNVPTLKPHVPPVRTTARTAATTAAPQSKTVVTRSQVSKVTRFAPTATGASNVQQKPRSPMVSAPRPLPRTPHPAATFQKPPPVKKTISLPSQKVTTARSTTLTKTTTTTRTAAVKVAVSGDAAQAKAQPFKKPVVAPTIAVAKQPIAKEAKDIANKRLVTQKSVTAQTKAPIGAKATDPTSKLGDGATAKCSTLRTTTIRATKPVTSAPVTKRAPVGTKSTAKLDSNPKIAAKGKDVPKNKVPRAAVSVDEKDDKNNEKNEISADPGVAKENVENIPKTETSEIVEVEADSNLGVRTSEQTISIDVPHTVTML